MRKIAPAFVLSALVALTSGSALALGDRNKEKKSPNADTTAATQSYSSGSTSGAMASRENPADKCAGLQPTDRKWQENNCASRGGGDGASAGASPGAAGGSSGSAAGSGGSSSSGK